MKKEPVCRGRRPGLDAGAVREGPGRGSPRDGLLGSDPELDIVLFPDGTATFSWNTPDIQEMAESLGSPEFVPPRWCG